MTTGPVRWILVAAAAVALGCAGASAAVMPGDVNGDGKITVADAMLTLRFAVGLSTPTADQLLAADVAPIEGANGLPIGDGKITVPDAVLVLRAGVGLAQLPATYPGQPAQTPYPLGQYLTLDVGPNTTQTFTLPDGVLLSGVVRNSAGAEVAADVAFAGASNRYSGSSSTNPTAQVKQYRIAAAAGTYNVTISTSVDAPSGGSTDFQYRVPEQLTVQSAMTKDFALPPFPTLYTVSGKVTSLNPMFTPSSVSFEQTDDVALTAGATAQVVGGQYSVKLPAGHYRVEIQASSFSFPFPIPGMGGDTGGDTGGITIPGLPDIPGLPSIPGIGAMQFSFSNVTAVLPNPVAVSGDTKADLVMPMVYTVSGKATMSDGTEVPIGGTVSLTNAASTPSSTYTPGLGAMVMDGSYSASVLAGTYDVTTQQYDEAGSILVLLTNTFKTGLAVAQDMTLDVTFPKFTPPAATAKLTGTVVDARGKPLSSAAVNLSSTMPVGQTARMMVAPKDQIKLDQSGSFSVALVPGTYTVLITPKSDVDVMMAVSAGIPMP